MPVHALQLAGARSCSSAETPHAAHHTIPNPLSGYGLQPQAGDAKAFLEMVSALQNGEIYAGINGEFDCGIEYVRCVVIKPEDEATLYRNAQPVNNLQPAICIQQMN